MWKVVLACLGLTACWTGSVAPLQPHTPPPVASPSPVEPSYRDETIAVDAIGIATMTAGLVGLHRGGNENLDGALMVTGLAIAGFGDPVLHLVHGHEGRALASYLTRAVTTTMGVMIGVAASDCRNELFCGFEGALWGTAGGLAVAGIADALTLHGEITNTWTPTVIPSDGGARVGVARAW